MSVLGYLCGLDLGQAQDYTALAVAEVQAREHQYLYHVRYVQRFALKTSYPVIVRSVADLLERPPLRDQATLVADTTGVGQPVIEMLKEAGVHPIAITITSRSVVTEQAWDHFHVPKRDLVSAIQILLQSRCLSIAPALPDADLLKQELANFQVKITAAAHDTYGAWREGSHDDLVLALAVAMWYGSQQRVPGDYGISF
jgi:Terminase RNaseH-like domain